MTSEQFHRYQEQSFDSFTKITIRNESANAHNEIASRMEKEVSFSCLSHDDLQSFQTVDIYRPYRKTYHVRGNIVQVYDPTIGELLQHISPSAVKLFCFVAFWDSRIQKSGVSYTLIIKP